MLACLFAMGRIKLPLLVAAVLGLLANVALAQRPIAPKMLPDTTIAYLRVADTPRLVERFRETALGRIGGDEQIKPLVSQFYATLQETWGKIEGNVGVPLDQLLRIPQGEICLAYVSSKEGPTGLVVLLDVKDQMFAAQKLLDKGEAYLTENGGTVTTEMLEGVPLKIFTSNRNQSAFQFEKEGTIVATTSRDLAKLMLASWSPGGDALTLADNDKFTSIMSRCAGTVDDPPQITYYVDPIEVARRFARNNATLQTGLALLPVLGLDGLKGVGGSITFATGEFDNVDHLHVLLDSPRAGVLEMLALGSGDVTPEPWVPADCTRYTTLHWKLQETFSTGAKLYNSLMTEGELQREVKRRISDPLGADFETEVLPALDGRVTLIQWVERPIRINSVTTTLGLKLKDAEAFQPTFEKIRGKFGERLEKKNFGGMTYYAILLPEQRRNPDRPQPLLRTPEPCVAILGDYLILTDSREALQKMIITATEPKGSLAHELEYKLIASKIKRQNGGDYPAMVQFSRPEEAMRYLYDLGNAEETRKRLARQAEKSSFFKGVDKTLQDNPLPPFSVIAKYLAPAGAMITSDETGIHYSNFTLRRK